MPVKIDKLGSIIDEMENEDKSKLKQKFVSNFKHYYVLMGSLQMVQLDVQDQEKIRGEVKHSIQKYSNDNSFKRHVEYVKLLLKNIISEYKLLMATFQQLDKCPNKEIDFNYLKILNVRVAQIDMRLKNICDLITINEVLFNHETFKEMLLEINRINSLAQFMETSENIAIVGSNGSGKTTFASYLKDESFNSIVVIPSQKYLYYQTFREYIADTTYNDINSKQFENIIGYSKNMTNDNSFDNYITTMFTQLIVATINDYTQELVDMDEGDSTSIKDNGNENKSYYRDFKKIWSDIFPELIPSVSSVTERTFQFIKGDNKIGINELSEGEKTVIYNILSVLMAPENSIIIVDEPENHLNPALFVQVWNKLMELRPNSKFIFLTHSIDFLEMIPDLNMYWVAEFIPPYNWSFSMLEKQKEIPKEIYMKIIGSTKNILYCEGNYESHDYKIYNILFGEEFQVIPVEGKQQVINHTRMTNEINQRVNYAIGIIDRDNMLEQNIRIYADSKIFVLKYAEIEMLLLSKSILKSVLETIGKGIEEDEIEIVNYFIGKMRERKQDVVKKAFDENLSIIMKGASSFSNGSKDKDSFLRSIESRYDEAMLSKDKIKNELELALDNNEYDDLLTICNLKNQIYNPVKDKVNKDYTAIALRKIQDDEDLKKEVKDNLFLDDLKIEIEINNRKVPIPFQSVNKSYDFIDKYDDLPTTHDRYENYGGEGGYGGYDGHGGYG